LAKSAAVLGKTEDAEIYAGLHKGIVEAFGREFFTPTGRIVSRTQTACILALQFDLCPAHAKNRTMETLVELLKEHDNHLTTGVLGTPFVCRVLSDNRRPDLAYELLFKKDFPSWLYQVTKGATTIWEHWDGQKPDGAMWSPDMNSFNHYAYGSVCDWVFSSVGGLDADWTAGIGAPPVTAFKRAVIKPLPGGALSWAETAYQSGYGRFYVRWEKTGGHLTVNIRVPPNTTALVTLPGAKAGKMRGVEFLPIADGAQGEIGSGSYMFKYPI
jgi:alpha-L-rhamnosidase